MRVLLSGEGPTDIGTCTNAQGRCAGADFRVGPMTVILSELAEPQMGYQMTGIADCLCFVSESELAAQAKARHKRLLPARGAKREAETGYYFVNAMTLGTLAREIEAETDEPVLAVLFRDSDGTRSSPNSLWQDKLKSMHDGFLVSGFECGVPMLPKPKSEVWLLCHALAKQPSYAALENISGNDASPNSAKAQLDTALGGHKSGDELCDWLITHPLDAERAETIPSFKAFRDTLQEKLHHLLR